MRGIFDTPFLWSRLMRSRLRPSLLGWISFSTKCSTKGTLYQERKRVLLSDDVFQIRNSLNPNTRRSRDQKPNLKLAQFWWKIPPRKLDAIHKCKVILNAWNMTKIVTFMLNKKQTLLKLHSWKCTESRVVLGDRFRKHCSVLQYTLHWRKWVLKYTLALK